MRISKLNHKIISKLKHKRKVRDRENSERPDFRIDADVTD